MPPLSSHVIRHPSLPLRVAGIDATPSSGPLPLTVWRFKHVSHWHANTRPVLTQMAIPKPRPQFPDLLAFNMLVCFPIAATHTMAVPLTLPPRATLCKYNYKRPILGPPVSQLCTLASWLQQFFGPKDLLLCHWQISDLLIAIYRIYKG